jgi:hypothetical protein
MKLNPKPEIRNPKEGRNPKPEISRNCIDTVQRRRHLAFQLQISNSQFSIFNWFFGDTRRRVSCAGPPAAAGFMLTEALVYIGLVFLLLGIGSAALYRCIDNSVALRRNADDILRVVHAGELWRADVRGAKGGIAWDNRAAQPVLRLKSLRGEVDYQYDGTNVLRRIGSGPWSRILDHVKVSAMNPETRSIITGWRWELELQPTAHGSFKPGRVRPLFTFLAAPGAAAQP